VWIAKRKRNYPALRLEESEAQKVTKEGSVEVIDWVSKTYHATVSGKGAGEAFAATLDFMSAGIIV